MLAVDILKNIDTESGPKQLSVKAAFTSDSIHGIFGNSGQGKTTLFNVISGIQQPDSGRIFYNENVWYDNNTNLKIQKRGIGYIFQENSLFPNFTIRENILFALPAKEQSKLDISQLLEQVGLKRLDEKYPSQLSGGQKQRAIIARLLVQKPELILIDEPFTGLDFEIKHALFKQIKSLHQEYKPTVLLITHDVGDIENLCDKVHLIKNHSMQAPISLADFKDYIKERTNNL